MLKPKDNFKLVILISKNIKADHYNSKHKALGSH